MGSFPIQYFNCELTKAGLHSAARDCVIRSMPETD